MKVPQHFVEKLKRVAENAGEKVVAIDVDCNSLH
jgi:hypothetical protein